MRFQIWLIIFKLKNNKAFRNDCLILFHFSKCFMFWLKALSNDWKTCPNISHMITGWENGIKARKKEPGIILISNEK